MKSTITFTNAEFLGLLFIFSTIIASLIYSMVYFT